MRRSLNRLLFASLTALLVSLVAVSCAWADPGWGIMGEALPTVVAPGGEAAIQLTVINLGSETSPGGAVVTDTLPEGLTPTGKTFIDEPYARGSQAKLHGCSIVGQMVTCVLTYPTVNTFDSGNFIYIDVRASNTVGRIVDRATVSGGGALEPTSTSFPVTVGTVPSGPGIAKLDVWVTGENGESDTQAGSHPYALVSAWSANQIVPPGSRTGPGGEFGDEISVGGSLRNLSFNIPSGFVGNAQAIPQCPRHYMREGLNGYCPLGTQVGRTEATVVGVRGISAPVYNMVPPPGMPAQLAFQIAGDIVFLNVGVRTGGDNGITVHVPNLPEADITFGMTEIWGVPAEESHNRSRAGHAPNESGVCQYGSEHLTGCPPYAPTIPYLTLPTSCGTAPEFSMEVLGTWEDEKAVGSRATTPIHDNEENPIGLTGCERLQPFNPSIVIAPDTSYADTPAGLSVVVRMPQGGNPEGLQTPGLKGTSVVLPEGLAINPGQATGLQACQPSQEALGTLPDGEVNEGPVSCPAASKVGTVELTSPLLRDKLIGNAYILQQNPPNLQMLVTASADGVNVKLVGNIHLDENTGQIVTTFEDTPDVPFNEFKLNFSGGAQAALATPTKCGTYESNIRFEPWSSPFIQDQFDTSRFQITSGPNGTPCEWPLPFEPTMTAGATTDQAGGYTDFTMLLQRSDGQQRIKSLTFTTPEGLLGMISKVLPCPEPQAALGTCSPASQIGHTVVGAGPGPYPFYLPQAGAPTTPIYLTGPYKGAPFGLSIVVPLIAGPFNLGTEVIRARLEVNRRTSQVTIVTEPFPVTVKGIPDDLRLIDADIDRPGFMFNPTSCSPMSFSGTAYGVEGATAPLSSHFQMGSCQALKFQPNFQVFTTGKTSRSKGASLTARLVYPVGNLGFNQASSQANINSIKVDLPKQLPSRLTTLQKACTAKTFATNPAACPSASVVGHVKAVSPVLPVPLEGPAYFVSHAGEEFPNLIMLIQGDNVTVELIGDTFINSKTNITSSTFKQVPDVPIQSFEITLPQGPYSALAANTNLCTVKGGLKMPTSFIAQNGATLKQNTPITVTGCGKAARAKAGKAKARRGARRGRGLKRG